MSTNLSPIQQRLTGVHTALITPFLKGEIDWVSLKKLVRQQIDGGVQGIVVCGTTGETPTLSSEEKTKLFEYIKSEVAGAVTLVMGTGSNSTSETIQATRHAKQLGATAALVVVPYYNKPSQTGLIQHFTKVANEGGLPIILYNVPSRTISKLEAESIQELAKVPGIIAIKEATGNIELGQMIASETSLMLASGDDESCMKLAGVGGRGVISVISHLIPKEMTAIFGRAITLENDSAVSEWAKRFGALNRDLYCEANPIPLKYALHKIGLIASAELRLPLTELDKNLRSVVDLALKAGGLL
ncbi:4-hydroxy-tetrahydrodipicolinate synthase [soil metagenome]